MEFPDEERGRRRRPDPVGASIAAGVLSATDAAERLNTRALWAARFVAVALMVAGLAAVGFHAAILLERPPIIGVLWLGGPGALVAAGLIWLLERCAAYRERVRAPF